MIFDNIESNEMYIYNIYRFTWKVWKYETK